MNASAIDLNGLLIVLSLSCLFASVGFGLDKLLLPRQRTLISERLLTWWSKIETINLSDIIPEMARLFLRIERTVLGSRVLSLRWFVTTIAISATITTVSIYVGDYLWFGDLSQTIEKRLYPLKKK